MAVFGPRRSTLGGFGGPAITGGPFRYSWELPLEFPLQLLGPSTNIFEPLDEALSCQVEDVGVQLIVQVLDDTGFPVNVGVADVLVIKIMLPDGTSVDHPAEVFAGGPDGRIVYVTGPGDLPEAGFYQIQGKVTMGGAPKSTRLGQFIVEDNVDAN